MTQINGQLVPFNVKKKSIKVKIFKQLKKNWGFLSINSNRDLMHLVCRIWVPQTVIKLICTCVIYKYLHVFYCVIKLRIKFSGEQTDYGEQNKMKAFYYL